ARLERALVEPIHDAVAVGVLVRAAVVFLGPGLVGAFVVLVQDAVFVVVGIGAAVLVLEAVFVLGLGGALVAAVRDAVTVGVAVAQHDHRRVALLARRAGQGRARVLVRDAQMLAGPEIVALVQLGGRKLDVGFGQRQ